MCEPPLAACSIPTFGVDLLTGVGKYVYHSIPGPDFSPEQAAFGVRAMVASLDKLITYIYSGPLPLIDSSYAFQIPCFEQDREGDSIKSWDKYQLGMHGRYGHIITPITALALATPVMRRDVKDQRFRCQVVNDSSNQARTKDDLEEC